MSANSSQNSDAVREPPRRHPRTSVGEALAVRRPDATDDAGKTRTIAVLKKNAREEIRVRVTDLGGTSLIDLRVFSPSARTDHEPIPTRNGICLPRAQLRALIEALECAEVAR